MIIRTKIEFDIHVDDMDDELLDTFKRDGELDVEDLSNYAIDNMVDDIYNLVKYNEVRDAIDVEILS